MAPPRRDRRATDRVADDLERLTDELDAKHSANEERFDRVENRVTEIGTQVKIIVALLIANGLLNVAHFFTAAGH